MSNQVLPPTMRAMQLTGFGDVDRLQLVHAPRPEPSLDEVLIKVGACGLNNTDLNLRKGWYGAEDDPEAQSGWQQRADQFPIIQGADIVGVVVGVGAGVADTRIGERVIVNPTLYNAHPENPMQIDFVGSERNGGFAEYVCIPAINAHRITSEHTDIELATFPTAYLTAWHMLERAHVTGGETVLVTGASGGVGSALVQLILARDAHVIAIAGRGKAHHLHDLGAKHVIARDVDDLEAALAGHSFEVVADIAGGPAIATLMHVIEAGGRIVTAGAIAGPLVQIDLRILYLRHLSLLGSTLGTASDFAGLVEAIQTGAVKPLLAATYPLEQLREAQQTFEAKGHFGKIVITV